MTNAYEDLLDEVNKLNRKIKKIIVHSSKLEGALAARNKTILLLNEEVESQGREIERFKEMRIDLHNAIANAQMLASTNTALRKQINELRSNQCR